MIYVGTFSNTFSKVLCPELRLGYMVVPPHLMEMCDLAQRVQSTHPPILEPVALADFLAEGHYARHLRRIRTLYAARQAALLTAIKRDRGQLLEVDVPQAWMHVVGWLRQGVADKEVARQAT